jgi:hypothetical protein
MADRIKATERGARRGKDANVSTDGDSTSLEMLRPNSDENATKWLFHRDQDGQWRWRKTCVPQGVIAESARSHASYGECVNDAKSKGYNEWLAPAKLRPLSFSHVPRSSQNKQQKRAPASPQPTASAHDSKDSERNVPLSSKVVALRGHGAT